MTLAVIDSIVQVHGSRLGPCIFLQLVRLNKGEGRGLKGLRDSFDCIDGTVGGSRTPRDDGSRLHVLSKCGRSREGTGR